jgi:hypothetical protein
LTVFSAYGRRHAKKMSGNGICQHVLFAQKQGCRFDAPDDGIKFWLERVKTLLPSRAWLAEGSGFDRVRRTGPALLRSEGIPRHWAGFFCIHGISALRVNHRSIGDA